MEIVQDAMLETGQRLTRLAGNAAFCQLVQQAGALLSEAILQRRTVFACGNGGSMCDAMHFAEELSGRFREDRPPLPAVAISDPAYLSCTANDYGYDHVFSRYVQAHARRGDVLVALSTSGSSRNMLAAARAMNECGGHVVALTGQPGSELGHLADVDLCVEISGYADRAQEVHIVLLHCLVQMVETSLFSKSEARA